MSFKLEEDDADTTESAKPFTEGGKCFDEVQLIFDNQQKLFVSQNFLILASPVFEAMFKNDFKEKQTMTVNMEGKSYDDVLEFLLCIHPGLDNTISKSNVLRIAPLAEEYQVAGMIRRCTTYMETWLNEEVKEAQRQHYIDTRVLPARNCLNILETAVLLNYDDLIKHAVKIIARFGHRIYYGVYVPDTITQSDLDESICDNGNDVKAGDVIKECRELFRRLPVNIRCEILSHRLALYPDNDMK